jgi:hypothetical protein
MLKAVKAFNAAAAERERRKEADTAASNPDPAARLNPAAAAEREGVPLWLWRGAGQG